MKPNPIATPMWNQMQAELKLENRMGPNQMKSKSNQLRFKWIPHADEIQGRNKSKWTPNPIDMKSSSLILKQIHMDPESTYKDFLRTLKDLSA